MTDEPITRGELYDHLVAVSGTSERWVIRLAGNDTHLLGISREVEHAATVAAAGVGMGPEVTTFIRPEGYLVTRFIEDTPVPADEVRPPETLRRIADSLRRIHDGPAIPGLFVPLRIVEAYRALALARGVRISPEYDGEMRPDRLARLTLMRIASDFREAMWGILQQGISTLDVDFVEYAGAHVDRPLAHAATPAFERGLRMAGGGR